jgi:two-component system CheB/CheR fusion protein
VGRPVGHIVSNLIGYDRLVADVLTVLDTLAPREVEVLTQAGQAYQLRIRPYRTLENVIEGAVMTFVDITERLKAREALRESESLKRLAIVMRDARDAVIVHGLDGRIVAWNPAATRMYGWKEAEATEMNVRDLTPESRREEALAVALRLARAEIVEAYRAQRIVSDGRIVDVWLTATALLNEAGQIYAIATTEKSAEGAPQ